MKFLVFFLFSCTVLAGTIKKECPLYPKIVVENTDCDLEIRELSKVEKYKLGVEKAQKLECLCNAQIKILSHDGKTEIGSGNRVMTAEITVYSKGEKKLITVNFEGKMDLGVPNATDLTLLHVGQAAKDFVRSTPQEALKRTADAAMENNPDIAPDLKTYLTLKYPIVSGSKLRRISTAENS